MRRFAAVIFDMDGLLLDTERLALAAFQSTCARFGLGDRSELFMLCIGANAKKTKSILQEGLEGIADLDAFGLAWEDEYRKVIEEHPIQLKDGAKELLQQIKGMQIPMAVATSTRTERARAKLADAGIRAYFRCIIGGDQVCQSKPDPEIYLKAAAALAAAPATCLALEDSTNGVKAAVAAGMTVIQVPDLVQPSAEVLRLGHTVVGSLTEVLTCDFWG